MTNLVISTNDETLVADSIISQNFYLGVSSDPISDCHWQLRRLINGLSLVGILDGQNFNLCFDFNEPDLLYRLKHGGRTKEPLAKAIGMKGSNELSVIDATAGMGRESFFLSSLGCHVVSLERQPIIYLLLQDAVERLKCNNSSLEVKQWRVIYKNSIEYLTALEKPSTDVVYLDPMFPQRTKSAAVKKEMRIFKQLSGADEDASLLLEASLAVAKKRVVVKRPKKAPLLSPLKPSFVIDAKKYRFDVYLTQH
ncbi:MAG: class I SAM-dependent methyltransferase [Gammaproteobacteria bacterium]|nr:class I SAM-dependent methyltransferase [Gammaproteobacteria bacterium]